ncbi:D-TA family PLP-dependent enzyme [Paraflavitalea pollutisoli]|uniref:D-TA family PLP-dependent enzyme n=1 Tax=Paraflavitalea pollutisoli TaxID=3034143 RepID=UPI0023ED7C2A|nr:D-TA family PLP-dependent enzyme [Paraflavitalea sp. H1-2-19X]
MEWYTIEGVEEIDSPALVVYADRVRENIRQAIAIQGDVHLLRPHVKTNKIAEVCREMLEQGVTRFKCATIAEAEMLALVQAPDILLAYQPVGPKLQRLLQLIRTYPASHFSCLVDNAQVAAALSAGAAEKGIVLDVYIDLNVGMGRTGIATGEAAWTLYEQLTTLSHIHVVGLHAYDGHVKEVDPLLRQQQSDALFRHVQDLARRIAQQSGKAPVIIAGGSPTFPTHVHRVGVECSPGTFVFWDRSYKLQMPELPFEYAALVLSRVISVIDAQTICIDLGHKSVAAEGPLPRVYFLNAPEAVPTGQSEEHLVLRVHDAAQYRVGDVLYGVPNHICPTVALYERALVIEDHRFIGEWRVVARDRKITI